MDFYYYPGSSICRSIIMAAKVLGLELNRKVLDTTGGQQLNAEFVKINPQHTIPTIVDNGFVLWESRAILIYLAEQYGKDDSLYPNDPQQKAVVNQCLYFDMNTLYPSFVKYYPPQYRGSPADPEAFKKIESTFELLNTFLENQLYLGKGDKPTVADIACLSSVSTFDAAGFDLSKYENVHKWYLNAQKVIAGWDENWSQLMELKKRKVDARRTTK
ncbi:uncharacterized protein Dwil_GK14026 [Drosophila willistoni]|uniref:Glutathione transferase n=1 Tax=Drosophila willistoni TaxID=7260 RepID=B4NL30_DROWI|nr:glutathione S-transferase 1-1 [Drosophila willistoni]EDW84233.1 uncharacterized protein Dwil_GK14026 [Drosophila willistoni]